jgi:hypothetical protein
MQEGDEFELASPFADVKGWYIDQTMRQIVIEVLLITYGHGTGPVTKWPALRPQTARSPLQEDFECHPEIQALCMTLTGHYYPNCNY